MNDDLGAQSLIYCAVEESIIRYSGGYFSNCQLKQAESNLAKDEGVAKKLWELSCDITGVHMT